MDINVPLLDLAVERTIRPFLIDQGNLANPSVEGYHHQKVIPKANPRLTADSIEADPRGSLEAALKVHVNLLSQFQSMKSAKFLAESNPDEIRQHALDLLHGSDPLLSRLTRFYEWSKVRTTDSDNKKSGMDPTVISYLLAMADPKRYAFCKPEVYEDAARHLLDRPPVEDRIERVVHATEFYKTTLGLFQTRYRLPFTDLHHVHIAFWVMHRGPPGLRWADLPTASTDEPPKDEAMLKHDLNLILYGPPGTGKTYDTIRRAVEICDGVAPEEHTQSVVRFQKLREENRVAFVTFHQAYSYEDFVEGLRPVLLDNEPAQKADSTSDIRYECRPGIFKRLCTLARTSKTKGTGDKDVNWDNVTVWKMSLGNTLDPDDASIYDECIANNSILLGWGEDSNFEDCDSPPAILARVQSTNPAAKATDFTPVVLDRFKLQMQVGDLVVISDGNRKFRAIARVSGPYRFIKRNGYQQMRPVEWLVVFDESLPCETIYDKVFSQQTLYRFGKTGIKWDALRELITRTKGERRNFVIIIDEINRGNIAKTLGELITLLEPDKRLRAENELQATLPYSGDVFGVPDNVYVIGTMNTADRSIAFLDVALRRRFHFVEMMPDVKLIRKLVGHQGTVDGIDIAELLQVINERIELLYDRDHQIGHSFFLGVKSLPDLRDVFCEKVIPLLQEYFYSDWAKVCLVLGCPVSDSERVVQANSQPIILAKSLKAASLLAETDDSIEDKLSCSVNPAFANAKSLTELQPMFVGMVGKANAK